MKSVKRKKINSMKLLRMFIITLLLGTFMIFAVKSSAIGSTSANVKVITVCPGDTLWEIAKIYREDEDVQKVIYDIMKANGMENSDIAVGQKLKIPLKY